MTVSRNPDARNPVGRTGRKESHAVDSRRVTLSFSDLRNRVSRRAAIRQAARIITTLLMGGRAGQGNVVPLKAATGT